MVRIIFMIDANEEDRDVFHEALLRCDPSINVIFAKDGIEALEMVNSNKPDLIFLDYNMPRMTGVECLKKLKANYETAPIPVVMYTTSGDREEEKVVLMLGADHFMKKTTDFNSLCNELERLLFKMKFKGNGDSLKRKHLR